MKKILLIYPPLGSDDIFIKDIPLSLIYLASDSIKAKYPIEILDLRLYSDWRDKLKTEIKKKEILLAGISVMTGNPIKNAIEITNMIKENNNCKIVWGGHHPTLEPDSTMKFEKIDYIIRGFGSLPLKILISELYKPEPDLTKVPSLTYRDNNKLIHNPVISEWEIIDYKDIPYFLIEDNLDKYNRFNMKERIIPIFTSMGCPHRCAFCMAPVLYKNMHKKWIKYDENQIIEHLRMLKEKYNATYISVYDDDSFIDINRIKSLLQKIIQANLNLKMDFRGARIDELNKLDDDFFKLMEIAGVRHFQIGLESGSQKILNIMNKKIRLEQIIEVNRKLSKYKKLIPIYNLMTGIPGETIKDIEETRDIVLQLYRENPNCIIGFPAKFKPLPGTDLYEISIQNGMKKLETLEDWIKIDTAEADLYFPWYSKKYDKYIKMFQITSFFIDNKIIREIPPIGIVNKIIRIAAILYRPFALFRLKNNIVECNIEYKLYQLFRKIFRG